MDEAEYSKEVIKSNVETKDEKLVRKNSFTDIVLHGNKKRHGVRTESTCVHLIKNDDVHPNLYSSNDNAYTYINSKTSDM